MTERDIQLRMAEAAYEAWRACPAYPMSRQTLAWDELTPGEQTAWVEAATAALKAQWVHVEESLPRFGGRPLLVDPPEHAWPIEAWRWRELWVVPETDPETTGIMEIKGVKHWMFMPEKPKENE